MGVMEVSSVRERSTQAARAYVMAARARLSMEQHRYGPSAASRRSNQQLERSISAEELSRMWPHADIEAALEP
jgi:hypothetical protein